MRTSGRRHLALQLIGGLLAGCLVGAACTPGAATRLAPTEGAQVTPATLAVEPIQRVGPGGHYLLDDHTRQFMRAEHFYPAVADRQNRAAWESEGKRDARQRANARAQKLLKAHAAPGFPADVEAALRRRFPSLV